MAAEIKIGSYTGTGAAVTVSLGWSPDYIRVWNTTDGDQSWEWFSGMAAASTLLEGADGAKSLDTTNGISGYAGSSTPGSLAAPGVTFGTDLSESAKVFRYVAMRNAEY